MIDLYFSSVLMQIGLFILLAVIIVMLFYVSPVCDRVDSFLARVNLLRFRKFILGLAFALWLVPLLLPILNAQFWGYGPVNCFGEAGCVGGYLYAIDERAIGAGKFGPPSRYLRLHLIDRATGRRAYNRIVGRNNGISGYRSPVVFAAPEGKHLLVHLNGMVSAYDFSEGRREFAITKDTLPGLVRGFGRKVSGFTFSGDSSILDVLTSDGYHILVNPFTLKIVNNVPDRYANPDALRLKSRGSDAGSPLLLSPGPRRKLLTARGVPVDGSNVFLDGFILQVEPRGRLVIIASYPDMNRQSLILSCISRDGTMLWQKELRELMTSQSPAIDFSAILDNNLVLCAGGRISSINVTDGRVNWQKRY